jgi:hypothetical protein
LPDILPDVVARLQKQLLAGYTCPIYPPINDSRGCTLTESEELSLKLYMVWVDSHGTGVLHRWGKATRRLNEPSVFNSKVQSAASEETTSKEMRRA